MPYLLETRMLSKKYKNQYANDKINFCVEEGSIYGLLGPNGAGKSTLLKMICGMTEPTEGTILFRGQKMTRKDLVYIGALIENAPIYEELTAKENLKIRTLLYELPDSRIDEVLGIVGLQNTEKKQVGKFSLGMKQRRKDNISALAHDIKTPVTIIKGNAELLQEERDIEQIYHYATVININTDRIEQYIRLLINETKDIEETNVMSVTELLANIKAQSKMLCEAEQILMIIKEDILNGSNKKIENSQRILRAVMNIVTNAIEYTDPEKGIELSIQEERDKIQIKVRDYGNGFSKEALCHATEQFYTEKKERSDIYFLCG